VRVYSAQADVFNARLKGYETSIQAQGEVIRAQSTTNKARSDTFLAKWQGYTAAVGARGEVARTQLESGRQELAAYNTRVQAAVAYANLRNTIYSTKSDLAARNADLRFRVQIAEADSTRAFGAVVAQLGQANADIFKQQAAAALTGMNALAVQSITD